MLTDLKELNRHELFFATATFIDASDMIMSAVQMMDGLSCFFLGNYEAIME